MVGPNVVALCKLQCFCSSCWRWGAEQHLGALYDVGALFSLLFRFFGFRCAVYPIMGAINDTE